MSTRTVSRYASIWVRVYTPIIQFVLRSRWTKVAVVVAAMVLFFASAALAPLLPTQFINAGSEKTLVVTVAPPTGASSDAVLAKAVEAETILLADEDVALVQTSIPGDGGTSSQAFQSAQLGRATNSATMTVRLDEDADVAAATTRLATALEPVKIGRLRRDGLVRWWVHLERAPGHRHRRDRG